MTHLRKFTPLLLGGIYAATSGTSLAQATTNSVDLNAEVGYSANPFLVVGDHPDSGFARVSARATHTWNTERTDGSVSAFAENTSYFRNYDQKLIFDLGAQTQHKLSERATLFGRLGFSGDFSGQLQSRTTPGLGSTQPPEPTPLPPDVIDPDLFSLSSRQYRLVAQVGATLTPSERSTIDLSAGFDKNFVDAIGIADDYSTYSVSAGYRHQISGRATVGLQVAGQYTDFTVGGHTILVNTQATINVRLGERWEISGAVGVSHVVRFFGSSDAGITSVSVKGSACWTGLRARMCAHASHEPQNTALQDVVSATTAGLEYHHQIDAKQAIHAALDYVHYARTTAAFSAFDSDYLAANVGYERNLSNRLAAGLNLNLRKLDQSDAHRDLDAGGSVYLRYRFGHL